MKLTYRTREDADDAIDKNDTESEELLCNAREGELTSIPRIWGLPDAVVKHEQCIAKGAEACVYEVTWEGPRVKNAQIAGAAAAAVTLGAIVTAAGNSRRGDRGGARRRARRRRGVTLGQGARGQDDARVRAKPHRGARARARAARRIGRDPGELTGTVLGGKYRIGRKIGSGGIGVVYAAEHVTLGHEVAVKVLRGAAARDGGEIARLRREAYIQVHVEHPNVCARARSRPDARRIRSTSSWSGSSAARSPTSSRATGSSRPASRSRCSSACAARSAPRTRRASSTAT